MTTGRQWIATDFGGPEVLQLREVDVPSPGPGEVTIAVRAAGMNPADYKHLGPGQDRRLLPLTIGYEAAGVLAAVGPGTSIASGAGVVGNEVIAFQVRGGYGPDELAARVRVAAPEGIAAVLDTVGSDEAVDASLALLQDRRRLVTLTAFRRAGADGFAAIGAGNPASGPFRAKARAGLVEMAAAGDLTVPIARTFPFLDAREAVATLMGPHPSGKLALVLNG